MCNGYVKHSFWHVRLENISKTNVRHFKSGILKISLKILPNKIIFSQSMTRPISVLGGEKGRDLKAGIRCNIHKRLPVRHQLAFFCLVGWSVVFFTSLILRMDFYSILSSLTWLLHSLFTTCCLLTLLNIRQNKFVCITISKSQYLSIKSRVRYLL